jgi:hypothetical protein
MTTTPEAVPYGCNWPVDSACFEDEFDSLDEDVRNRSVAFASATLRRLTGYRVGGCPITVRPCKPSCVGDAFTFTGYLSPTGLYPINWGGTWMNVCGHTGDCACTQLCQIALPPPVGRLDKVMLDGAEVTDDFRIDDGNLLTYIGGGDCPIPACQDMTLPDTEEGTFSVTYLNSYQVDEMGAYAAGVLALEFAKACVPGHKCRLPSNVVSITRQGVSMELDPGTFPNGTTGIREVDAYIGLWNPKGLIQGATVWYPKRNAPRHVG